MKPIALIIEDDPDIREALADRLESLGHDFHPAGSQSEARERLKRCTYDYVLLDLEVPTRIGRPPAIQFGKNILCEIRQDPRHLGVPVLVVTAHGHDSPDLAVELMKLGATDFVKKPFENLDDSIREALHRLRSPRQANHRTPGMREETRPLDGAELTFFENRVELAGVEICTADSGLIWRVMLLLRERRGDGRPRAFPGKLIADRLGLMRGQSAVCDAVSSFRKKVDSLLGDQGFEVARDSIIVTGRAGYQINDSLDVDDRTDQISLGGTCSKDEEVGPDDRQAWFISELKKERRLRRKDYEKEFGISTATAKRDIRALDPEVDFVGSGASGYYALKGSAR